jgi:probable HAF family extracellular repeat protein
MRSLGSLYCPCSFNVRYGTSRAFGVSNSGSIVGDSQTIRGETFRHAFVWQENLMRDLGAQLNALQVSYAYGVNDINEVVGVVNNRAFLARDGVSQDVGVLPGHTASIARDINNKGQVVGGSVRPDGVSRAFLWDRGTMSELGALPGDLSSEAQGINVDGDVVGRSGSAGFASSRAVLWRDGAAVDLNTLAAAPGWILSTATGLNDVRQIVGVGVRDGRIRAFLLTPQ